MELNLHTNLSIEQEVFGRKHEPSKVFSKINITKKFLLTFTALLLFSLSFQANAQSLKGEGEGFELPDNFKNKNIGHQSRYTPSPVNKNFNSTGFIKRHNSQKAGNNNSNTGSRGSGPTFYYKTYGGFYLPPSPGDTVVYSSLNMKPGPNDITQDGPWFREGPFSKPVQFGDQNNGNLRDSLDPNNGWPAVAMGHKEADPWISAGGQGDSLGGASGIGMIGYGYDTQQHPGRKIVVGNDEVFYPLMGIQHHNKPNSFAGSLQFNFSWNLELYDQNGHLIYQGNKVDTLWFWETFNNCFPNYGIPCPRNFLPRGTPFTDLEFSQYIIDSITPYWPLYGLGATYYGDKDADNTCEAIPCSDAITLSNRKKTIPFIYNDTLYNILIDGFYNYSCNGTQCPELDTLLYNVPIGNSDTNWQEQYFDKSLTIWSEEGGINTGWMRLRIVKAPPPIPVSNWPIYLVIILISLFLVVSGRIRF